MEAADIPWKLRKFPCKYSAKFLACSLQPFVEAISIIFRKICRESFRGRLESVGAFVEAFVEASVEAFRTFIYVSFHIFR